MASPTQWAWVWANSGKWWRTGKPGVLQSMGPQRVGHDWAMNISKDRILGWWGVCFQHFFIPPSSYLHGFRGEVGCNSYLSSCVGTVFPPTPLATLKVFSLFLFFCLNVVLCIYLLCSLSFLSCYEEHTVYISHGCFPFINESTGGVPDSLLWEPGVGPRGAPRSVRPLRHRPGSFPLPS